MQLEAPNPGWIRYGVALLSVSAALLIRWLLDPFLGNSLQLITLFGAVAATVCFGGWRPALLAALIGYLAASYLFVPPRYGLASYAAVLAGLAEYALSCAVIIYLGERMLRARERLKREIAERNRAEQATHGREQQLQLITDAAPGLISYIDRDQRYRFVNREYERWFGHPRGEVVGKTMTQVLGKAAMERLSQHIEHILRGQDVRFELELPYRDGGTRWVDAHYVPDRRASGEVAGFFVLVLDVSERKRAEQAWAELMRQQDLLYRFLERRHEAKSMEDIYEAALDAIMLALRCERASILLLDDTATMRFVAWRGLSDHYRKAVNGHSAWKPEDPNPQVVGVPDITKAELDPSLKAVVTSEGIGALAFIPLVINGKLAGKFMAYYNAPHLFSEEEVKLGLTIARQIALGIERNRAEEALRESEERYRAVVESQAEMLCRFRHDGTILFVNGAYARARGMTPDALIDRNFWEFIDQEDRPAVRAMLDRLTPGSPEVRIENRFETTDGFRWTLWTNRALRFDPENRWIVAQSAGIDITERKEAENAKARLAAIVESSSDAIVSKDLNGIIQTWNRGAERLFGYTAAEAVGRSINMLIPSERLDEEPGILERIRHGERIEHYETVRRNKDGTLLDVSLSVSPIINARGEIVGASKIARDITNRKRAEQALKELGQRKDEFLANMSHEIRSPLTGIMGYADILLSKLKDPEDIECLRTIKESGDYLIEIVNDILDLSKIEAGKLVLSIETVSVHSVLAEVQSLMDVRARQKKLPLSLRYEGALPEKMQTDRTRFRQILINLVSNAIKFTEQGRVEIVARSAEGFLQIEVVDTGIGIAPEHQAILFQPFTQADTTSTRQYGGTGLGLTITKRLVEMLGGSVSFESQLAKGSTFRIAIPTGPAREATKAPQGAPLPSMKDGTPLRHRHVLVVDDRQEFCSLVSRYIKDAGGRPTAVCDGRAAMEAIETAKKTHPFDAVILDIQMPGMDGYEVARKLRAKGFRAPIIALTAGAMVGDREKCLKAGCDDYLTKPIDRPALVQRIAHHAERLARAKLKVLLVDDSHAACKLLSSFLEKRGHEVRSAYDGETALSIAHEFRPDVIVLDIRLPDMNGHELMQRLKEVDGIRRARFIGVSGYYDPSSQSATEFDHFLEKPLDMTQLDALLRSPSADAGLPRGGAEADPLLS